MVIVSYIGYSPERFAELMALFLGDNYRTAQRASWAVGYCAEYRPDLVGPYLEKMIDLLKRKDAHVAVKRNVVRLLQFIKIPNNLRGMAFSHCYDLLGNPNEAVAIRCFSMTVAFNIAKNEPDLLNELKVIIAECIEHSPKPGFCSRARKILNYGPK